MSIDYLPDEMNYERSAHLWGGTKADAFNAGWRAACEAMHKKAQAKPAPDWRAACVVEKCEDGDWDVVSPCGKFWMSRTGWHRFDVRGKQRLMAGYFLGGETSARAALAACPTPPPDAAEAARGT
jgi:hypothetical protein